MAIWISDWFAGKKVLGQDRSILFRGEGDAVFIQQVKLGRPRKDGWREIVFGPHAIYTGELPSESPEAIAIDREYEEKHRNAQMDQGHYLRDDAAGRGGADDGAQRHDEQDGRLREPDGDGDGLREGE